MLKAELIKRIKEIQNILNAALGRYSSEFSEEKLEPVYTSDLSGRLTRLQKVVGIWKWDESEEKSLANLQIDLRKGGVDFLIIDIFIMKTELKKVLLPIPGLPPMKKSLQKAVNDSIQKLEAIQLELLVNDFRGNLQFYIFLKDELKFKQESAFDEVEIKALEDTILQSKNLLYKFAPSEQKSLDAVLESSDKAQADFMQGAKISIPALAMLLIYRIEEHDPEDDKASSLYQLLSKINSKQFIEVIKFIHEHNKKPKEIPIFSKNIGNYVKDINKILTVNKRKLRASFFDDLRPIILKILIDENKNPRLLVPILAWAKEDKGLALFAFQKCTTAFRVGDMANIIISLYKDEPRAFVGSQIFAWLQQRKDILALFKANSAATEKLIKHNIELDAGKPKIQSTLWKQKDAETHGVNEQKIVAETKKKNKF